MNPALLRLQEQVRDCPISETEYDATQAETMIKLLDDVAVKSEELDHEEPSPPPPLEVLLYAIRSILYPTFLYEQVPDFLRLLTMVEFHRLRATYKAKTSLTFQNYYKSNEIDVRLLKDDVEIWFQEVEQASPEWRDLFMRIVSRCCTMDIQRLWLMGTNTAFCVRWNEYFSVVKNREDNPTSLTHVFHDSLSTKDTDTLLESMTQCWNFLDKDLKKAELERARGQSLDEGPHPPDRIIPLLGSSALKAINTYLNHVSALVKDLNDVFAEP